jgi:hypothetical protein
MFDSWQRWGVGIDDVSFANAWVALGLAREEWVALGMAGDYMPKRQVDDLNLMSWSGPWVNWTFPNKGILVKGTPAEWAQAWIDAYQRIMEKPVRLRVSNAPPNEKIWPWYRMLSEANPALSAVSLSIEAPRAQLHIGWPLRLGCISDNAWNILERIEEMWPSSKVTQIVRLGRDRANCDVLIHKGSARELLQELLQRPFGVKANIVILQGGDEADWGEIDALLASILAQTRASGFIFVPRNIEDELLAHTVNVLVREISHANPMDVALGESIRQTKPGDVVAGFTMEIADFVVSQLVERYNDRLAAIPPGSTLDMSGVGGAHEWLTHPVLGGGKGKGHMPVAPSGELRHLEASTISIEADKLVFDHENKGSAAIAEVSLAMETARVPAEALRAQAARFLQQRSFVRPKNEFREAKEGFIAGKPAMVRVRIAAPEQGWDALPSEFPVEALPQHLESWTLTVWLSEPDHLPAPIKRQIKLPRDGNSTECEFHFRPLTNPRFEGRLTVLHRGRIIQTAVLRAAVVTTSNARAKKGAPKLEDLVAVRHRLGNLEERRQYDLAFVANHDSKGRALLTAVSENAAWVKNLSPMANIAAEINKSLSPVAKSVQDYAKGLDGKKGEELLVQLAIHGEWVRMFLYQALDVQSNSVAIKKAKFVQIVSTRADAVPLEFVYDYAVPQQDAKVCPNWRGALKDGKCPSTCKNNRTSGSHVCPMGFWGLQKVIERHAMNTALEKDGNVLYLQSEPTRGRDTLYLGGVAVLGSSTNVPDVTELKQLLTEHCGAEPKLAKDWAEWEKHVQALHPSLLVALPHTDGKGSNVSVELGNVTLLTARLKDTHVFPPPTDGRQAPLVALIGCDTAGTADDYGFHVMVLRERGAGIVIGTIATVFGEHAATVAGKLVEGLLPQGDAKPVRLGELMRAIRRDSLLDGLLMPLCLVAYGDADWMLSRKRAADA